MTFVNGYRRGSGMPGAVHGSLMRQIPLMGDHLQPLSGGNLKHWVVSFKPLNLRCKFYNGTRLSSISIDFCWGAQYANERMKYGE